MYAYDLETYVKGKSEKTIREFIERIRQLQATDGSRIADRIFLKEVGCNSLSTYNESYYKDVVNFDLALLMAHAGLDAEASSMMSNINGLLPGAGGDVFFTEHQRQSLELYQQQQKAAVRGMVSVLITSLPKSASAGFSQSIAGLMKAPVLRLSVGNFPTYALVKAWVDRWRAGGIVTHDHYAATPHNMTVLREAGVKRLAVQVRDPRSAAYSLLAMLRVENNDKSLSLEDTIDLFYLPCIQWLESWLDAERNAPWLAIHWIKFQDYKQHPHHAMTALLETLADNSSMRNLLSLTRSGKAKLMQANFNKGDDDAWREHASDAVRQRMWNALPPSVIEFLNLKQ